MLTGDDGSHKSDTLGLVVDGGGVVGRNATERSMAPQLLWSLLSSISNSNFQFDGIRFHRNPFQDSK